MTKMRWICLLIVLLLAACQSNTTSTNEEASNSGVVTQEAALAQEEQASGAAKKLEDAQQLDGREDAQNKVKSELGSGLTPALPDAEADIQQPPSGESKFNTEGSPKDTLAENPEQGVPASEQILPGQTVPRGQSDQPPAKTESIDQVSLVVIGLENEELLRLNVEVEEDDTVLDILKRGTRSSDMPMEYRGSGPFVYVEGINNLYEFDYGQTSGWKYKRNGEYVSESAGTVKVQSGDQITWYYVTEEGEDE